MGRAFAHEERTPLTDIYDAGAHYEILLEVPGVRPPGLEVRPGPAVGTLVVRAETASSEVSAQRVRAERGGGTRVRFIRIVPVGWDADVAQAKSALADGILTVTVPKARPASHSAARSG